MQGKRISPVSAAIAFGLLSTILIFWVNRYGPEWPYRDSFDYLYILDRIKAGNVGISDFLSLRNNEHFVAFHFVVGIGLLLLTGMQAKALIYANVALLVASALLIYVTVHSSVKERYAGIVLPFVIATALVNPVQSSYLIWEFQVWLYIDIVLLALNCFLIERYGTKAYPLVAILCILATGSEAQGSFLWVASGLHVFGISVLKRDGGSKWKVGASIFVVHCLIFLIAAWLLMHPKSGAAAITPSGQAHGVFTEAFGTVSYFFTLVGGGFGIRDKQFALWFGAISLVCWFAGSVWGIRNKFSTPLLRTAFILSATSLLWAAAFSVGRKRLGIEWAFAHFHASPLLLPFFTGIGLYCVALIDSRERRFIGFLLAVACIAPTFTAIPFGYHRSVQIKANAVMAEGVECAPSSASLYLKVRLSGIEEQPVLYDEVGKYRKQLCAHVKDAASNARLTEMPSQWTKLGANNTHDMAALLALWEMYLTHGDLMSAFPKSSATYLDDLLRWAAADARNGSGYEHQTLGSYADAYISLSASTGIASGR